MTKRHEDAVLFALRDECTELLDVYLKAHAKAHEARDRADADPACPRLNTDADMEATQAHWEKYGVNEAYYHWNLADRRVRYLTAGFFNAAVSTLEAVHAKLKFGLLLEEKVEHGDLETWPHYDEWLAEVEREMDERVRLQHKYKPTGGTVSAAAAAETELPLFDLASELDNSIGALKTIEANLGALAGSSKKVDSHGLYPLVDTVRTAIEYLRAPMNQLYAAAGVETGGAS